MNLSRRSDKSQDYTKKRKSILDDYLGIICGKMSL